MKYVVTSMLSENLHKTEDGFLICKNVPVARPGELVYNSAELPSFEAKDGKITASRTADDILGQSTIDSFEGKTVSYLHPKEQSINSKNWKTHAVGYTYNVRAGSGEHTNLLVADLLINDESAINAIMTRNLREVSLGYEARYTQDGVGRVRQKDIKGNHVALVPRGRCGSLCAIQDHAAPTKKETSKMSMKELKDKLLAVLTTDDADDDIGDSKAVAKLQKTVDQLAKQSAANIETLQLVVDALADIKAKKEDTTDETAEEKLAREKKEQEAKDAEAAKAKASNDSIAADLPLAEILSPGIKASETMKIDALTAAYKTADGKASIDIFTGGKEVDYKNQAEVSMAFVGAANFLKGKRTTDQASIVRVSIDELPSLYKPTATSPAQLNTVNDEFWNGKKSA